MSHLWYTPVAASPLYNDDLVSSESQAHRYIAFRCYSNQIRPYNDRIYTYT